MLALTAALVAPYFIDWTSYRADFEREASRILGREVEVAGSASARLLPFPSVEFTDVQVAGEAPDAPSVTVESFSMDMELAPFLRGEILIFDMRLVRPVLKIDMGADGGIDWASSPSTALSSHPVRLESITIIDGEVRISHGPSGRTHVLSDIDARASARDLAGPWRLDGTMIADGEPVRLSLATGSVEAGRMRLRVQLEPEELPVAIETDGSAFLDADGTPRYEGAFRATIAAVDAPQDEEAEPVAAHRLTGDFSLGHSLLEVPEFTYQTGPVDNPYLAEGNARVDFGAEPHFLIEADGAQLRLAEGETSQGAAPLQSRLSALEGFLSSLPRPAIPGSVNIRLPALVAGDTTIREVEVDARPEGENWRIDKLSALLPGRATVEAEGALRTSGGLSFTGELLLAIQQPSGFAAWLGRDVDEAVRRLPAAGFSAEVTLTPARQSFENLELALGAATFRGSIRHETGEGRPLLDVALDGGRLDSAALSAFISLFLDDAGVSRFAGHDVDVELAAGPVAMDGFEAASIDTAFRLREDAIEIDRLHVVDLDEANISATGRIDLGAEGATPVGSLDLSVVAVDLAPLVARLAERFPDRPVLAGLTERARNYPGLLEDAALDLVAEVGEDGAGALTLAGEAGGSALSLDATVDSVRDSLETAVLAARFSARNEEAAAIYGLAGLPGLPIGFAGALEIEGNVEGRLVQGAATTLTLRGDGLRVGFDGQITTDSARGSLYADVANLSPWLATAGASLPEMAAGVPLDLRGQLNLSPDGVRISDVAGSVVGTDVRGDFEIAMEEGRPQIAGTAGLSRLHLAWLAKLALGEEALANGEGWPQTPFQSSAQSLFSASLSVTADAAHLGPHVELDGFSAELTIDEEGLRLADVSAESFGGALSGRAELENAGGTGLLSAEFALEGAEIAAVDAYPALAGSFDLSAVLNTSGKSVEAMVAALAGSGTIAAPELAIRGLNAEAGPQLIARADRIGREIDADSTAGFAPALVRSQSFDTSLAATPFSIAGGALRVPPFTLEEDEAHLSVDLGADLVTRTLGLDAVLTYELDEELAGAQPSVRLTVRGSLADPSVALDTQPLSQFLVQRAFEIEQARVAAMQARLLEAQRLRRENRYYAALQDERLQQEELRRQREEEEWMRANERAFTPEPQDETPTVEDGVRLFPNDAALRSAVERFLGLGSEEEAPIAEELPAPPPPERGRIFEPENLTIEGLLGKSGSEGM